MAVSIKICGLNSEEAIRAVIKAEADYAGFIYFPKSPRHITIERATELKALLPSTIKSVSVLVNPDDALLEQIHLHMQPDYIQLHGSESVERIREIRRRFPNFRIIKAVSVSSKDDIKSARVFEGEVDMLMYDAKPPADAKLPGGNGISFDWKLLKGHTSGSPWFLSGGLTPKNVAEAIQTSGTILVDVSSGVESAPGVKDPALIAAFVKAANEA